MKKILLGLVLSLFVSAAANANIIIDDFTDVQVNNTGALGIGTLGEFTSTADRTFTTTDTAGIPFTAFTSIGGGSLDVFGLVPFTFSVRWDNFDGTGASLSPAISTLSGALSFALTGVEWSGVSSFDLTLALEGGTGSIATSTVAAGATLDTIYFFFTDFTPSPDLLDVTSITLSGATSGPGAFAATSLVVTPEPSSLILGGIGLLVMGGYGYRRRRRSADTNATSV